MIFASLEDLRIDGELRRIRADSKHTRRSECELCGSTRGLQAHHERYDRPLDTITLCASHHRLRHSRLKRQGRCPVEAYFAARRAGTPCPVSMERKTPAQAVGVRWARWRASQVSS